METRELHLVSMAGNQDPASDTNTQKLQSASEKIINLLEPVKLWVFAGPERHTTETAGQINECLGNNSLNPGNVAINGFLAEGAVGDEGAEEWLSDLNVRSGLALLRSEKLGQIHKTGLLLVTSADIVAQIPEVVGAEGYSGMTNSAYGQPNHLAITVDSLGNVTSS